MCVGVCVCTVCVYEDERCPLEHSHLSLFIERERKRASERASERERGGGGGGGRETSVAHIGA
jgi:hypothetical protein